MQITDTITSTVKDFDVNERVEQLGQNYTETADRVIDIVVDTNKKVVDVVVTNATKVTEAVESRLPERPLAERIPTPAEAGKAYLDMVERAADWNRDVNRRVVDFLPASATA